MKPRASVFTLSFLFIGLGVVVFTALTFHQDDTSLWRLALLGLGGLFVIWTVATILNFAVFAPIFWLMSKLSSKRKGKDSNGNA